MSLFRLEHTIQGCYFAVCFPIHAYWKRCSDKSAFLRLDFPVHSVDIFQSRFYVLTIQGAENFYQLLAMPTKSSAKQDQRAFRPLAQTDRYIFRSIRTPIWVVTRGENLSPSWYWECSAPTIFALLFPAFFLSRNAHQELSLCLLSLFRCCLLWYDLLKTPPHARACVICGQQRVTELSAAGVDSLWWNSQGVSPLWRVESNFKPACPLSLPIASIFKPINLVLEVHQNKVA
jgi:hypothetical protein